MIAILLTVFGIIDPVGIVGQYTQNASTLDMVRMVSKVLVHPSTLTICIIFINLLILGTVYYQMFKKINIKILYATIALTFSINLLIDGVIMRGIREGDSCRIFAERILKEYPLNKKNVYVVNNLRIYRNLYGLNFYMGNIFHDFDKETPAKGYFLIGENEMEKVLSTYGDKSVSYTHLDVYKRQILGIVYLATGGHSNMDFHSNFFPDFSKFDNLVLAASIFLFYAGMEMGGIHVKDVDNPSKNYPKAVFIGALITVVIFVLGTFALGIIIPEKDINLTQSLLVGFDNYFKYIHASWLSPIIAIALAFGVLAGVLTWVAGPSKGIFAVGKAGYLPPFFQKTNKIGVQKNILYIQGAAVTLLSLLFVVMPSVQSFYQILSQLTVILYLIMYMLMFSGAIALRYKMKKAGRPFRIGKGGNGLMWLIGGLGFCGSLLAFVLSFIPPSQISTGNNTVWFAVLFIGVIVVVAAPFIIRCV